MSVKKRVARTAVLPLLALRGMVAFPQIRMYLDIGRQKSALAVANAMEADQLIFMVAQMEATDEDPGMDRLHTIGVVAKIRQVLRLPGEHFRILVEGLYRARVEDILQVEPFFQVEVKERLERRLCSSLQTEAAVRECRQYLDSYLHRMTRASEILNGTETPHTSDGGYLADYAAANLDISVEEKQVLLSEPVVSERLHHVTVILARECAVLDLEQKIHEQVQKQMDQNQKEYYLREQLRVISLELGGEDNPLEEAEEYRRKIRELSLDPDREDKLLKECGKLAKMPFGSHEATVVRGYLDTCLALPWNQITKDRLDLTHARKILDRDHYGLDKVKERIVESLAVRQLSEEMKGQVICLVGPPGVGKTSIAKSIAEAMGRRYVRISLGGVKDEADIRGHRRTYIGAMPGRILTAIQQAGAKNPLILLDEIDKMGSDFRGDPAAAMLEVLDSEQNYAFCDHYLEVPFDLSEVLFLTTANDIGAIPTPLCDRMEIIELSSYTAEEKFHIAKEHLLKKQAHRHGLTLRQLRITDTQLKEIIQGYTREAGVRGLERCLSRICRKAAKRIVSEETKTVTISSLEEFLGPVKYKEESSDRPQEEVGVVNGLAWTAVGGETMPVEVAILDGSGKIELTGSLGDVMKESARTAVSYVRSKASQWHIDTNFYKTKDIHIHVPEGAVPKDGPSAGVTMATALVSALTGIPVRQDVAMTGEISLRGRVLPIGGLKEKTMAAYTHRMKTVIIPADNASDLAEVEDAVRDHIHFVTARRLDTVLDTALTMPPQEGGMAAH